MLSKSTIRHIENILNSKFTVFVFRDKSFNKCGSLSIAEEIESPDCHVFRNFGSSGCFRGSNCFVVAESDGEEQARIVTIYPRKPCLIDSTMNQCKVPSYWNSWPFLFYHSKNKRSFFLELFWRDIKENVNNSHQHVKNDFVRLWIIFKCRMWLLNTSFYFALLWKTVSYKIKNFAGRKYLI